MNIFVLSLNPRQAARWHADKHVVKMILEAVQMLYTAHWIFRYPQLLKCRSPIAVSRAQKELSTPPLLLHAPGQGYRPVHVHHPCTRWVRQSVKNYEWLCRLALALAAEYTYRWPNRKHSCEAHAQWLLEHPPSLIPKTPLTPFAIAMPIEYRHGDPERGYDAIRSYRAFYRGSKQDRGITDSYTARHRPHWL